MKTVLSKLTEVSFEAILWFSYSYTSSMTMTLVLLVLHKYTFSMFVMFQVSLHTELHRLKQVFYSSLIGKSSIFPPIFTRSLLFSLANMLQAACSLVETTLLIFSCSLWLRSLGNFVPLLLFLTDLRRCTWRLNVHNGSVVLLPFSFSSHIVSVSLQHQNLVFSAKL